MAIIRFFDPWNWNSSRLSRFGSCVVALTILAFAASPTSIFAQELGELLKEQPKQQQSEKEQEKQSSQEKSKSPTNSKSPSDPVTAEEKKQVSQLLKHLASDDYHVRNRARKSLNQMGTRFVEVLETLPPPTDLETRIQIVKLKDRVGQGALLKFRWQMETWPMAGQTLNLDRGDDLVFFDDGSFTVGQENGKPETWIFDSKTGHLRLSFNGGYAIYRGEMNEAGEFVGTAKNTVDKEWHFRLTMILK